MGRTRGAKRDIKKRVSDLLDLPEDILMDLPRLSLVGNVDLTVSNHRGVVEYTPAKVVIGVYGGQVEVSGEDLVISHVLPEEIRVVGKIAFLCMT